MISLIATAAALAAIASEEEGDEPRVPKYFWVHVDFLFDKFLEDELPFRINDWDETRADPSWRSFARTNNFDDIKFLLSKRHEGDIEYALSVMPDHTKIGDVPMYKDFDTELDAIPGDHHLRIKEIAIPEIYYVFSRCKMRIPESIGRDPHSLLEFIRSMNQEYLYDEGGVPGGCYTMRILDEDETILFEEDKVSRLTFVTQPTSSKAYQEAERYRAYKALSKQR